MTKIKKATTALINDLNTEIERLQSISDNDNLSTYIAEYATKKPSGTFTLQQAIAKRIKHIQHVIAYGKASTSIAMLDLLVADKITASQIARDMHIYSIQKLCKAMTCIMSQDAKHMRKIKDDETGLNSCNESLYYGLSALADKQIGSTYDRKDFAHNIGLKCGNASGKTQTGSNLSMLESLKLVETSANKRSFTLVKDIRSLKLIDEVLNVANG